MYYKIIEIKAILNTCLDLNLNFVFGCSNFLIQIGNSFNFDSQSINYLFNWLFPNIVHSVITNLILK